MKIIKKMLAGLTLVILLCLTACSGGSILGKYRFQLGKTTGESKHVVLEIELTDKDHDFKQLEPVPNAKDFIFTFDNNMSGDVPMKLSMKGYYAPVANKNELKIGVTLYESTETGKTIEIPSKICEKIAYCYMEGSILNFKIPVSEQDVSRQLYFYGYKIELTSEFKILVTEFAWAGQPGHLPGDTPTKEWIAEAEKAGYGRFHTLTLGLAKE